MQRLQPTHTIHTYPELRRFTFLSPRNQRWIADYLVPLRTHHYALSTQEGALRALKCFAVLMPEARQVLLYQPMVLVSYKLNNNIGILQTELSHREGHEARRVGLGNRATGAAHGRPPW